MIHPFITKYGTPYDAAAKRVKASCHDFFYKISNPLSVDFDFYKNKKPLLPNN